MKPFAVFLPILFCVSLFGCEKYEERAEQVVWRNDASCDLDVTVFTDNGLWSFVLPQTGEQAIYEGTYRIRLSNGHDRLTYQRPFEQYYWLSQKGKIDSVQIRNLLSRQLLLTATQMRPYDFCNPNKYEERYQSGKRLYLLHITDSLLISDY